MLIGVFRWTQPNFPQVFPLVNSMPTSHSYLFWWRKSGVVSTPPMWTFQSKGLCGVVLLCLQKPHVVLFALRALALSLTLPSTVLLVVPCSLPHLHIWCSPSWLSRCSPLRTTGMLNDYHTVPYHLLYSQYRHLHPHCCSLGSRRRLMRLPFLYPDPCFFMVHWRVTKHVYTPMARIVFCFSGMNPWGRFCFTCDTCHYVCQATTVPIHSVVLECVSTRCMITCSSHIFVLCSGQQWFETDIAWVTATFER